MTKFVCNKCGYVGASASHYSFGEWPCNYLASPVINWQARAEKAEALLREARGDVDYRAGFYSYLPSIQLLSRIDAALKESKEP